MFKALAAILFLNFSLAGIAAEPGKKELSGHVPPVIQRLAAKSRLPGTNVLDLAIGLPVRNPEELSELLRELYDPASPNFHQFLTPPEFAARFGPTVADYEAVAAFARSSGLTVRKQHPNRLLLDVEGPADAVERAFNVTLRTYRHPTEARDFFAPDTPPQVAANLAIADVSGLENFTAPFPLSHLRPAAAGGAAPNSGSGPSGTYRGYDFRAAYVPGTPLNGVGQAVALVEFDGYYSNDIASYETQCGLPSVPLQNVLLDGFSGNPSSSQNAVGEVSLDIEMVVAMAPGLSNLLVYEGNTHNFIPNDVLSQIANDNKAAQVSSSWSWLGGPNTTTDNLLAQMATQGQCYFQASGDSDAYTGANHLDTAGSYTTPMTSPYVTAVGGTTLYTTGPKGAWVAETVWNWTALGQPNVGSSGGISANYSIPSWQTNASLAGGRSTTKRNIPDVALTADNIYVIFSNGLTGTFGGTSVAAPLWAGFLALANQQSAQAGGPRFGLINPLVYSLATSSSYPTLFHDITIGNNFGTNTPGLYNATNGYDLCTGLGTPTGTNLINAIAPTSYAVAINPAGWTVLAESAVPANGTVDPGETVTVGFILQNTGNLATSNLVATLLSSSNVLLPDGPHSYGGLPGFGGSGTQAFTFTAAGSCGSTLAATFQLQDGTNNLGSVVFQIPLGQVFGLAQNFDGVTAPALPLGWSSLTLSNAQNIWAVTTAGSDTAPNAAYIADSPIAGENALVSPVFQIQTAAAQLSFRHNYNFDFVGGLRRDGGVLEMKIGNGPFKDFVTNGGVFTANGYNSSLTTLTNNPLSGRRAWVNSSSGVASGWKMVTANLPAAAAGQSVQLRWCLGTDTGNGSTVSGWFVDSITVTDAPPSCVSIFTDLAALQSATPLSFNTGSNLVCILTITNLGPQTATAVVVTDTAPANVNFLSASGGGVYANGAVTFNAGTLAVGVGTNFTVTFSPQAGTVFTNQFTVATITPENNLANNTALLTIAQSATPPGIVAAPANQLVECGGSATFSLVATGTPPLSIQWSLDGLPVSAATNVSATFTNLHLPGHAVSIVVTNFYGVATNIATLSVQDTLAPVIVLNGANPFYVELGGAFTNPGATATDACAGSVAVVVSGSVNTNAASTNLLVYTATDGSNAATNTRTVIVRDTTPPTISWSFTNLVLAAHSNCVAVMPDVTGTNFFLASDLSTPLTLTQNPTNNSLLPIGTNFVVIAVADAAGNTAYVTNSVVVQDQTPPLIFLTPQSRTNAVGDTVTFTAAAAACTSIAWQWFFKSAPLTGATNSTLVLTNVTLAAAGNYVVSATAAGGSSSSAVATLTIAVPPGIGGITANPDGSFGLTLTGTPGGTYVLESTTNLWPFVLWLPLATNMLGTNGVWTFTDTSATNFANQFYRLRLAP